MHDVAIRRAPHKGQPETTDELKRLRRELSDKERARERTTVQLDGLESFAKSLKIKHMTVRAASWRQI